MTDGFSGEGEGQGRVSGADRGDEDFASGGSGSAAAAAGGGGGDSCGKGVKGVDEVEL